MLDEDFFSYIVYLWEKEGQKIEVMGIRMVYVRFGVMFGEKGVFLFMIFFYKFLVGGMIGIGRQWLLWIYVEDVVQMI